MTSDSRSCKDSSSVSSQNLRPIDHQPCCSLICFDPFVRFPNLLLRNTKRLSLTHRAPPIAGWLIESGSLTQPLRSHPFVGDFIATTGSAPESPLPYSRPRGSSTCGFSVSIEVSGSYVPLNRLIGKLRP